MRGQGRAQAVVADRELTVTGAGGLRPIPGRGSVGCGTLQRVLCIAPGMLDRVRMYAVLDGPLLWSEPCSCTFCIKVLNPAVRSQSAVR